ncbi:MAG: MgtC/SapB family protein [Nitrosospira sp.]|nr:MgtC/SapB family protein [Nitrosospira sp.]
MISLTDNWMQIAVALGIGLLIGVERERRKSEGRDRAPAGVRTYAITALLGSVSFELGGILLLAVVTASVAGFVALGYFRTRSQDDPGLTSEYVQLLTLLLGALAMREPLLASALGVTVALLLVVRTRIHYFVRTTLTETELHDALVLSGAALVVLPLMPDRYMGPLNAINPHTLWIIVVLMLAISAGGYIALRLFGSRYGLPAAGLASGFVSSSATIASMGTLAKQKPELMPAAVSGAVLSTVATIGQMTVVLGATDPATLAIMVVPLLSAGLMAVAYAAWFLVKALRQQTTETIEKGRAFSFRSALILAATMAAVLLAAAALNAWLGNAGLIAGAAIAGFADTHAPAVSIASLAAGGKLEAAATVLPILLAMSTNTVTKIALAASSGGGRFASQVIPGLLLTIAAGWLGGLQALIN